MLFAPSSFFGLYIILHSNKTCQQQQYVIVFGWQAVCVCVYVRAGMEANKIKRIYRDAHTHKYVAYMMWVREKSSSM